MDCNASEKSRSKLRTGEMLRIVADHAKSVPPIELSLAARKQDMASSDAHEPNSSLTSEMEAEMKRCGITRIPIDYFHVGEFRYTNLKDAIAQAKRHKFSD